MALLITLALAAPLQCGGEVPGTFQRVAAISGDWLVSGHEAANAASVHPRVPGGFGAGVPLVPANPEGGAMFGYAVAIDGGVAVVGRPLYQGGVGTAHVFELAGGAWVETAELHASDEVWPRHFGWSVDVDGDAIAVGAPRSGSGRAYVFERSGAAWVETAKVEPGCCDDDQFGWSVAISGDALIVGTPNDDAAYAELGSASVYRKGPGGWALEQTLVPTAGFHGINFGRDVAISGALALVGVPGGTTSPFGGFGGGIARLYAKGPSGWSLLQTLTGSDTVLGDVFGSSVALAPGAAVVGAPYHDEGGTDFTGAAYVFAPSPTGTWQQIAKLGASPGFLEHGFDVDTDGQRASIAALFDEVEVHDLAPADMLVASPASVSLSAGGAQSLALGAGLFHGGLLYLVAGSASGTSPGITVDGVLVPLNVDAYTLVSVAQAGSPPFVGTVGFLDACGEGSASLVVPPGAPPSLAGIVLHHALVGFSPAGAVVLGSEAEALTLAP